MFHVIDDGHHGLIHAVVEDAARKKRQHRIHADTIDFRGGVGAGKILTQPMVREKRGKAGEVRVYALNEPEELSDWFLPTRYDLNLLYLNRAVIGGYSDFSRGWRKSEVSQCLVLQFHHRCQVHQWQGRCNLRTCAPKILAALGTSFAG